MTQNEFAALCGKYLIDPDLALENDNLRKALEQKDAAEVERILKEEF